MDAAYVSHSRDRWVWVTENGLRRPSAGSHWCVLYRYPSIGPGEHNDTGGWPDVYRRRRNKRQT